MFDRSSTGKRVIYKLDLISTNGASVQRIQPTPNQQSSPVALRNFPGNKLSSQIKSTISRSNKEKLHQQQQQQKNGKMKSSSEFLQKWTDDRSNSNSGRPNSTRTNNNDTEAQQFRSELDINNDLIEAVIQARTSSLNYNSVAAETILSNNNNSNGNNL